MLDELDRSVVRVDTWTTPLIRERNPVRTVYHNVQNTQNSVKSK